MEMSILSSAKWKSEQVGVQLHESLGNGYLSSIDVLDDFQNQQYFIPIPEEETTNFSNSLSPENYTRSPSTMNHQESNVNINIENYERPLKQIKTKTTWKSSIPMMNHHVPMNASSSNSSSSHLIAFATDHSNTSYGHVAPKDETVSYEEAYNLDYYSRDNSLDQNNTRDQLLLVGGGGGNIGIKRFSRSMLTARGPSHSQDHVMAERKRRERLTERFIALSALVPDLKKLDKASVLGDAIKYMKQLQERVKLLEEETKKKPDQEAIVSVNSCKLSSSSSCVGNNSGGFLNKETPEIEARVLEKNVLIRMQCQKQKGLVPKMLSEIEKLHLTVINTSALPFGDRTMDITVIALMEDEFCSTPKGLVRNLQAALI